ncbi:hypothetical protein CPB83DRAFT_875363 [Crepidotus variabilis]|uniref:GATA-type domain-containing protein n=1 Tax=Crepidotus variabilis TaxID=179855 RepID=A0A9P6EHT1_9AGAR|nr:hypothetical protein CPB83DRAFT_875363 [Crepidotus variabilis]
MPSILNLKFKGNKSFVAFSNLADAESLTQTWKVCTKVASFLEQGQRLENLSWRLWHLQNLIVDTDNAKSRREFKKLSKVMGDKLDKEKGRSIEELSAPDFKRNHSTDMIKQRAAEKERNREASLTAPGTIKRMQFTFSIDQPISALFSAPVKKPDTKPSPELSRKSRTAAARAHHEDSNMTDADSSSVKSGSSGHTNSAETSTSSSSNSHTQALHFPTLFNDSFGPSALLYAAPTLTNTMTYGEGYAPSGSSNDTFRISRPTIEVPLDEILFNDDSSSDNGWASAINALSGATASHALPSSPEMNAGSITNAHEAASAAGSASASPSAPAGQLQEDVVMTSAASDPEHNTQASTSSSVLPISHHFTAICSNGAMNEDNQFICRSSSSSVVADDEAGSIHASDDEDIDQRSPAPSTAKHTSIFKNLPLTSSPKESVPDTIAPARLHSIYGTRSSTPTSRPTLTLRTQGTTNASVVSTRSSGPGATATSLNPAVLRGNTGNSAPGGVKAECSNCGATHTPLWRRGLNDELNCNACGLYCKLHKRPRPKSMRNSHGESRAQPTPRPETVDVVGRSRRLSFTQKGPVFTENQAARPSVAAQCYNCHTTATPLWRKDDEGKTVCNACGLYYKLHGSARPISMKSDVIRKRSRHDARRASQSGIEDMLSTSPGISSRRSSPARDGSPTLAPDSTTQMTYEFGEDQPEFRTNNTSSELMGALGNQNSTSATTATTSTTDSSALFNPFPIAFPGPYHPDYLMQFYGLHPDPLPFSSVESSTESDPSMSPRSNKRRRMSTDSASSYSSYGTSGGDGYTSAGSTTSHHSKRGSMEFPFNTYNQNGTINNGPALRGSGNTFWHPPMMPQNHSDSETFWHPPLVLPNNAHHVVGVRSSTSPPVAHKSINSNINSRESSGNDNNSATTASTPSSSSSSLHTNDSSPMDYLQAPMIQDDELFSAYLHPHDEKTSNVDNGAGAAMYVDSYYQ